MNLLDLYETREPYQQAIDRLEARRIEDLHDRMDELMARAKTATPEVKAALMKEFQKVKDERDGYYKIKEQQTTPPSVPKGIGDLQDPKQKMAQLQQKAKKGPLANVGAGLKAFFKGEPEPMDEEQVDQSNSGPRAFGVANFQRLVKANMGNIPTVTLEFSNPADNIKLDKKGIDLISDYYDSLESDSTKNHFIYRVLPSADETNNILKKLGWTAQVQQELPGIPTQGELPLSEKKKFGNDEPVKSADVKVDRELQKLRARYPAAGSDLEAVARAEIDGTERSQQQLTAIRGANEKQDALLKQLVQLDQDQGREIDGLDKENDSLEQRLAQVQATNDRLQQTIGQMTGIKKGTTKANKTKTDAAQGGIIDVGTPAVTPAPSAEISVDRSTTVQPTTKSAAIDAMTRQIQGFNKTAPSIRSDAANDGQQQPKVVGSDIKEHGGGIGPRQHWQDLMPEQSNPEEDDWYDDEPETELRSGDYVRDTMDGEHGEIFRMQGDPYERRVRILDRDGKGWYIEPSRLIRVDADDIDVQKYFGKRRRDVDESALKDKADLDAKRKALQDLSMNPGVDQKAVQQRKLDLEKEAKAKGLDEGWSDRYVAQRTGRPRTPYSVYIKGKKWKDFENDDHARAVMDKLKAKFKADGRDPSVITIAPTDIPEGVTEAEKEPTTRQELLNRLDKIQRMMTVDRNPANLQILRKELEMLKQRYQHLREDNNSEAVEIAIIRRVLVAHTDLIMEFGLDKVTQAIEEVAYNVGDLDEIGSSDVSGWVRQVEQILGANEINEESQQDRNARIIAGELEDAKAQGNQSLVQQKIKELKQLGYYFDKQGRLQAMGMYEAGVDEAKATKTRLDPKCWSGKKIGNPKTKVKGGVRVNNCVPAESVAEGDKVGNMDADKFDDAMARLKKLAGQGPMRTVYDPQRRVYKNVPTAVQPSKQPKK